ncbi:MAG TPA: MBL fold metallo-hydrolase [Acidimicrobiia bacterium]|nr:MBL fold metallo-hydrolase [Acidimicrobiia bacterium]
METRIDEIADNIFRISTHIPEANFGFNQFLVNADEPLLFHTGSRNMFPLVRDKIETVVPVERLRWITFGHVEADECGAMNEFLALAPQAQVAHGAVGCMVQVNDLADRPPLPLEPDHVLDLGGKRVRNIDTPHVPHGWDAHVMFEETTRTLFVGDLFTAMGAWEVLSDQDILEPALAAEAVFGATALTATTAAQIRALADLEPVTLALMHGPSFNGDCEKTLLGLGDGYEALFDAARQ